MNIDTGSDMSWVQCAPCAARSCYSQKDKLFDPTKSNTYAAFSCGSAQCAQLGVEGNGCLNSQYQYIVQYGDGSATTGTYGCDTLMLTSSDVVKNFQFGCSHRAAGFVGQMDGLMGLGGDRESLVSQTAGTYGKAFSYCLPRPSSSTGFLTLGAAGGGGSDFARTPMVRFNDPTFYGVFLQAITVAGTRLNVSATVFSGESIVDSGTVITQLPPTAYQALRAAFRKEMKAYPSAAPVGSLDTCFNFNGFNTITVPKITLTFSRGAVMDLDISGILYAGCFAFTATGQDGDNGILGNVQQRTLEVLFDVSRGAVGFRPSAC
ncbi:Aspartyl protease family protein [Dichanthelium oligosanthes]|uniref:Aspartyl protease family protein n=1 Tax=Dichanthelium oligosanthes TaxID=888268 RepID=A0A1E5WEH6_9POAL|nr:Aspartyl protease family protein [Dichanthelium oligosanthes]